MSVWLILVCIDKLVAAQEKLGDVSPVVMCDVEFATRVDSFETVHVKDKVVENYQRLSFFDCIINLVGRESPQFVIVSELTLGQGNVSHGVPVANAVDALADYH